MKHPFWLLNSALLLLFVAVLGFVFFSNPQAPEKEPIEPEPYTKKLKTATAAVNINKIYENDLFDTYQREVKPLDQGPQLSPFPEPPAPTPVSIPPEAKPQFLEPLNITLKGIFVVLNDDSKNRAIIADNKTNKETIYKVGDAIEDAQLVRIFSNKILLIRSNGQQEVLYLREKDAKTDPLYASIGNWNEVVQQMGIDTYIVNVPEFTHRIQTLGQFIDTLDLTTVYKGGLANGTRIGQLQGHSLGSALGLVKGDIILKVNDILVTDTQSRLDIFKQVMKLKTHDNIHVSVIRGGEEKTMTYTLAEFIPREKTPAAKKETEQIMQQQMKHLEEKKHFAPTLQDIIERERKNMIEKGKRPAQNVLSNLAE